MQNRFSLYRSHLEAAHFFWHSHLGRHSGNILDATLGQGKDTIYLAEISLELGEKRKIFAVDVQEESIERARLLLERGLSQQSLHQIKLLKGCHSKIDFTTMNPLTLIIYNLGYLPGGDKSLTTQASTTEISLQKAMNALSNEGLLTITCYPGHDEGKRELQMMRDFLWNLPKEKWSVTNLQFAKESTLAPTLWVIQKSIS